jgi:tRNA-dihydrouridine synthase A
VDDQDADAALRDTIGLCARAGVKIFAVHARKAWLQGLSPKENRDVPPLDYELVYRVKREHPKLTIVLNGGIETLDEADAHLTHVDGAMMGRAAYHSPAILAEVDARFFGGNPVALEDALQTYMKYVEQQLGQRVPLHALTKPMLGLFNGRQGARLFRRHLAEQGTVRSAGIEVLRDALRHVERPSERVAA